MESTFEFYEPLSRDLCGGEFRKEPYLPEYMRQFDTDAVGSEFKSRKGR